MSRILVVEDNALNLELVRELLTDEGYEVLEAQTGTDGIRLATGEDGPPDLILMDLKLPEMDGLEVTRRLRSNAKTAKVPIVALTAHAIPGEEEKALDAGCDGFISKPIEVRKFVTAVAEYLRL